jgi:hypothetical protein
MLIFCHICQVICWILVIADVVVVEVMIYCQAGCVDGYGHQGGQPEQHTC